AEEPGIGAAQGKLFQISPEGFLAEAPERRLLDSAGHVARPSRMVVDRGQGARDAPAFGRERSVFSATGAALFLRRAMLDDIAIGDAPFDPAFFAYKEDIDLCWRARLHGWDVRYVPSAVGHHVRAMPGGDRGAWRSLPAAARRHSWKNHYLMVLKNDRVRDLLRSLPSVLAWEAGRLGFAIARDPALLRAYLDLARLAPGALRARRRILDTARRRGVELHAWFGRDSVPAGLAAVAPGPRPIPPGGP
ncbi:MAG: glycosyltransferase, partial [Gemmatimonadetes bacterium]|nr:glycosyltransferase family 2 protein [Gemmatimonadota bacterium]NIQ55057.1 glycosyltransferase family 2 protein [Gemmatimonadota bacterium]NIU75246.1 glycosyltransferase [Gammaproteobacteria bacterium]NIX45057.1 glycosyltransferase [Gemmatimonadota bacterium]NIY09286.1 glycosyltransferase [Gemmatimonadota bacterium]